MNAQEACDSPSVNRLYPSCKDALWTAQLNVLTDTIRIVATAGFTYNGLDQFLSDVAAGTRIATTPPLVGKTVNAGVFDASSTSLTYAPAAPTVTALVLYQDTGVEGTSRLIGFEDDGPNLPFVTNPAGGTATLNFNAAGVAIL